MVPPGIRSVYLFYFCIIRPETVLSTWHHFPKKMAESEEEVDVLVQRVVKDISNAFKRNPNM